MHWGPATPVIESDWCKVRLTVEAAQAEGVRTRRYRDVGSVIHVVGAAAVE